MGRSPDREIRDLLTKLGEPFRAIQPAGVATWYADDERRGRRGTLATDPGSLADDAPQPDSRHRFCSRKRLNRTGGRGRRVTGAAAGSENLPGTEGFRPARPAACRSAPLARGEAPQTPKAEPAARVTMAAPVRHGKVFGARIVLVADPVRRSRRNVEAPRKSP